MPEIICPSCGHTLNLPSSYNWYHGAVPCKFCGVTFKVSFGEFRQNPNTGAIYKATLPRPDSGEGGAVLIQPQVVEIGNDVPEELLHGTGSASSMPDLPHKTWKTALWGYKEGRYEDAVVRCRVTLETILKDQGVPNDTPSRMVKKAIEERLLPSYYGKLCEVVATLGGQAAHAGSTPISQADALLMIGIIAAIIRMFYPPTP